MNTIQIIHLAHLMHFTCLTQHTSLTQSVQLKIGGISIGIAIHIDVNISNL
jgi:hypothetical protein